MDNGFMLAKAKDASLTPPVAFGIIAVLYNTWPLGYILNPNIASTYLASDLERIGQPFYWLFFAGDLLVGGALMFISATLLIKYYGWQSVSWTVVYIGLFFFGLFTVISAASNNDCTPHHFCLIINRTPFGLDGMISVLAAICLLISLVAVNFVAIKAKHKKQLRMISLIVSYAWAASGALFLLAAYRDNGVHVMQEIQLVLSGLALFIIGLNISDAKTKNKL